jgi:AraC-like DNA-binding protein
MKEVVLFAFAFFCGHSLFLAVLLFLKHKNSGNKLLGILLILLTVRVGKSVLILYKPELALPASIFGLSAMAAAGSITYFYILNLFSKTAFEKLQLVHFVPAIICLFLWKWSYLNYSYYLISILLCGYLLSITYILYKNKSTYITDNIKFRWATGVTVALWFLTITFILQLLIYMPILYLAVVGLSSMWLYALSLWAFRQNSLFTEPEKRKLETEAIGYSELGERIKKKFEEGIYLEHDLNLSKFAKILNEPPYLVSKAINSTFNKSFPEMLLTYRISQAEQLLLSQSHKIYTIEAIAFESGFSTLSAFYQAFKKTHSITPTQYKKQAEKSSLNVGVLKNE